MATTYNPQNFIPLNKPVAQSGNAPEIAKMQYFDEVNYIFRPFISEDEANEYIPIQSRGETFIVQINSTGTIGSDGYIVGGEIIDYWYPDKSTLTIKTPNLSVIKNTANGIAGLDENGKLSESVLPTWVDSSMVIVAIETTKLVITLPSTPISSSLSLWVFDNKISPTNYTLSTTTVTITGYTFVVGIEYTIYYKYQEA